jgi:hypothetical protein
MDRMEAHLERGWVELAAVLKKRNMEMELELDRRAAEMRNTALMRRNEMLERIVFKVVAVVILAGFCWRSLQ